MPPARAGKAPCGSNLVEVSRQRTPTLRELVQYAYQRHAFDRREVTGGPAWIDADRFDVLAKPPAEHTIDADASFRQTWSMIRTLRRLVSA